MKHFNTPISLIVWTTTGILFSPSAYSGNNTPNPTPFGSVPQATLRFFSIDRPWTFYSEAEARNDLDGVQYRAFLAGTYYRPVPSLKVGAFYRREYGVRHDEDWQLNPTTGSWSWAQVNGRGEDEVILDASPRLLLPFLPGEKWVAELKSQYVYDFFNSQQTLILRPGLTYFLFGETEPVMEFFLQEELYVPLNYGNTAIYQTWTYLGVLYNLTRNFQVGVNAAYHSVIWGSPPIFVSTAGNSYDVQQNSIVIGLLGIIRLDFTPH